MPVRENYSDHLDRLFDKIAAAVSFRARIPESIEECTRIVAEAKAEQPAFSELGRIVGPRQRTYDKVLRKNAWLLQHLTSSRVYCVGNYVVFKRRARGSHRVAFESPILDQLSLAGLVTGEPDLSKTLERLHKSGALLKCGGICVDAFARTIYVMGGISYSQARRLRPSVSSGRNRTGQTLPLFGQLEDRPISGAAVPRSMVECLNITADLIRQAVAGYKVKPVVIVSADPEAGWQHQIHEVEMVAGSSPLRLLELDEFPLIRSSLSMPRDTVPLLEQLPPEVAAQDVLRAAPVDRATRAFMALAILWDHQVSMPGRLASLSVAEIATRIRQRYLVSYSRDLRRHDLEDCLVKLGYIESPLYQPSEYAITHRGVGRLCMFMASTSGLVHKAIHPTLEQNVVYHIMQQAARWDEYCFGPVRMPS